MSKSHNSTSFIGHAKGALPQNGREALQWFVDKFKLYIGSARGLFLTEWMEDRQSTLEAAIINLKSRDLVPMAVTGQTLYQQADYLWKEARTNTQFGRPLASKVELEIGGSDLLIIENLMAPENGRHLWYLYSHILYPRGIAGKATIITTPLTMEEFRKKGEACPDPDFRGKGLNWERLQWLMDATLVCSDQIKELREKALPPMLKAEYELYNALKERGIDATPQHVLGDYVLDFALIEKERRLNIECDSISTLGGVELQRQEAKRNLVLFSDGWQVLKFTTAEILANKGACADVVDEVWRAGRKRGSAGRVLTGNTVASMPDLPVEDDVQHHAITFGGGPVAIAGGAGTGKTTCITQRVSYLLGQGVNAENILVLTFATDSQRALKKAIEQLVEKQAAQRLNVFSWHDLGLRILKENLPAIKRKPPLKIETSPQKVIQRLLTKAKKDIDPAKLELSVDLDEFYISAVISMYKAHLISPKQAKEEASNYSEEIIAKVYQALEDQLQKANKIDRDDVIAMAVNVLLEQPELRARYQQQYEFVLVDEYQDVTVAQDMLARLLAAPQDNLFIAGDEDESMAESKNACCELFTEISLRMPYARCYVLERNWRSHPAIVDHARQLASGLTRRRMSKEFHSAWGQAPAGAIIGPAALSDEREEAAWVASEIQLLAESGRNYGDMAVLFRHHVYATILEEALDERGVRYQASNPITNFIPDEVEDMLSFLKLVIDPDGPRARESFERVCQLRVKEIDPKLSGTIASFAEANNLSYLKAIEIYSEATADQSCRELEQLVRMIRTMYQDKLPPVDTIALIRRTQKLNDYYRSVKVPPGLNYEPLKKLTQLEEEARSFSTTTEFVKHIANQKQSGTGVADAGVQVIPILDSKSLEFPVVFMVGMAEGIFPSETALDMEEERRICYVGFTRAKELLYLSYPLMFSGARLQPSHFLVDARLLASSAPWQDVAAGHHQDVAAVAHANPEVIDPAAYAQAQQYELAQQQAAQAAYLQQQQEQYAQQQAAQLAYEQQQQYAQQLAAQQAAEAAYLQQQQYAQELAAQQAAQAAYMQQQQYAQQMAAQQAAEAARRQQEEQYAQELAARQAAEAAQRQQEEQQARELAAQQAAAQQAAAEAARRQQEEQQARELAAQQAAAEAERRRQEEQRERELAAKQAAAAEAARRQQEEQQAQELAAKQAAAAAESARRQQEEQQREGQRQLAAPQAAPQQAGDQSEKAPAEPATAGRQRPGRSARSESASDNKAQPPEVVEDIIEEPQAAVAPMAVAESVAPATGAQLVAPAAADAPVVTTAAAEPAEPAAAPERAAPAAAAESAAATASASPAVAASSPAAPGSLPPSKAAQASGKPGQVQQGSAEGSFQVYLPVDDSLRQRPGLPALPRSKSAPVAEPAAASSGDDGAGDVKPGVSANTQALPPSKGAGKIGGAASSFMNAGKTQQPDYLSGLWDEPAAAQTESVSAEQPHGSAPSPSTPAAHDIAASAAQTPVTGALREAAGEAHSSGHGGEIEANPFAYENYPDQSSQQATQQPYVHPSLENQLQQPGSDFFAQHVADQAHIAFNAQAQSQQQPAQQHQSAPYAPHQYTDAGASPLGYHQHDYQQHGNGMQQPGTPAHSFEQHAYPYANQYPGAQGYDAQHAHGHVPQSDGSHPMCPQCHCALEANARFCGECGYTLPERVPACPVCGAPLEGTAKFCGECGTSLTGAPVIGSDSHLDGNVHRMQELKDKQNGWMNKILKMLE